MRKKQPDHIREHPMTYDDYKDLPFEEGVRYELVDGSLQLMTPSASAGHQLILSNLYQKLTQTCEDEYIILFAPLDVILSDREVRQPDLLMIHRKRLSIITKRGVEGPPDLVAEILSPSSIKNDKMSKMKSYARYAIPEYWIVDAENEALEQYQLDDGHYKLTNIYSDDETIQSEHIKCAAFSMKGIMSRIPHLPNA